MKLFKCKGNVFSKLILFLSVLVIPFVSCNKDKKNSAIEEPQTTPTLMVADFSKAGEIHNAFLTNTKNNFKLIAEARTEDEKINVINDFNKQFALSLDLPAEEKQLMIKGLEEHKELVLTKKMAARYLGTSSRTSNDSESANVFELIAQLKEQGQINDISSSILNDLSSNLKSNYQGIMSDDELKINISSLVSKFNKSGYNLNSGEGQMVGTILAVSLASVEWWEENPDAFAEKPINGKVMVIPVWAAADVIGGVIGAGTGALGSYVSSGEVNWKAVGVGTVAGAVTGSTGIVGKLAKWLVG